MAPIEAEIRRFLADSNPEVLCIRGKWGVGKTFAWKKFLRDALSDGKVQFDICSYVSLFGIASIREAKRAIFENQVSLRLAENPSASSIGRRISKFQGVTRRSLKGAVQLLPWIANAAEELANAAFGLVHDQIICLDDLERLGEGLRVKDVLGLVSYLREERDCKVVLLLNAEPMSADDKKDFNEQIEKVVDVELEFAPTPAECATIGLSPEFPHRAELEQFIIPLGIANIRTIKRIERMSLQALVIVDGLHDNVRRQVLQTVTIGTWAKHEPADAPPLDYIMRYNAYTASWDEQQEGADPQKKVWNDTLQKTGFTNSDDLDVLLLNGIQAGFFESEPIRAAGMKIDADHAQSGRGSAYSKSWRLYHDSFQKNDDKTLDAMFDAVMREPDAINPSNMSATLKLFRELGRDNQANKMIQAYVEAHQENRDFFDLSRYPFEGDVTDEALRKAFADEYESFIDDRDPAEVLLECARRSGWNRDDEELLGKLTAADFVNIFERLDGEDTSKM